VVFSENDMPIRLYVRIACLLPVVASPSPPQTVPVRRAVEIHRIGGLNAPEYEAFADEPTLIVDLRGMVYARVPREGVVRIFDSAARHLGTIGRQGSGPGEFVRAAGHGLLGDTLWIRNWPLPFISLFSATGQHLRTWQSRIDTGHDFALPAGATALLQEGGAIFVPDDAPSRVKGRVQLPVLVGNRDLSEADTIVLVTRPDAMFLPGVGTFRFSPVPTGPLISVASDGNGVVVASWDRGTPERVDVRWVDANGRTTWRHSVLLTAPEWSRRTRDSLIARGVEMATPQIEAAKRAVRLSSVASVRDLVRDALELPDRLPPIRRVVAGLDGRIWLERMSLGGPPTWLVMNRSGSLEYQITLPERTTLHAADGDFLWATQQSADDVPYIVWFRVDAKSGQTRIRAQRTLLAILRLPY
jgi:hypothetical protein